ncbi:MAG: hypothetical protein ACJAV7_001709, partial [Flavobacteriales bacterium]
KSANDTEVYQRVIFEAIHYLERRPHDLWGLFFCTRQMIQCSPGVSFAVAMKLLLT